MQETTSIIGKRCAKFDEIISQVKTIAEYFNPEKIILFGSYATGEAKPDSDVDLCIIINSNRSPLELSAEISLFLDHVFPIDIIVKSAKEIERRIASGDYFIQDIINNGQVLYEQAG